MIDLTKLPKELKIILSNLLVLPFWYISIFIFNKDLYYTGDNLLIFSLCICLGLSSSIISSVSSTEIIESKNGLFDTGVASLSLFIQIVIISVLIYISYIFSKITSYIFTFESFVSVYFFIIISICLFLIKHKWKKDKKKKIK